ncbi:MAG: sigma-70 family RNA polymerase sigma factor [Desulfomonile tiedjei]|uniref:Sigma-70 family RNA polymerase sigma factor n=1 Tax=Desulfomonile tiedjei TaxID=2358 RepID=A0A9D6V5H1_9BACT|nr:sigma-70 family RNA polymerase sigma factor [Desulfomonile tiedjei]
MSDQSATFEDVIAVPPTDATISLVQGVLAGQKEAEARFYEIFLPVVRRVIGKWNAAYCRSQGRIPVDEDDESQGILIRLIYGGRMRSDKEGRESPLWKWLHYDGPRRKSLYRYVQWNAHFYLRDVNRKNNPINPLAPGWSNPSDPTEDHVLNVQNQLTDEERWQLRRCIRKCWERLNPSHREVLEMVGLMGLTQTETALKLGVAESTISRWLRDAASRLETCLRENCPEELLPFASR